MDRKRREGMLSWRNLRHSPGASVQGIRKGRSHDSRTCGIGIKTDAEFIAKFGPLQS
jgi:hypothetical protein